MSDSDFRRGRGIPRDIAARGLVDPAADRKQARVEGPRSQVIAFRDPYDAPIPGAQDFVINSGAVATAAVETLTPAGLQLLLDKSEVARISSVTIYITSLLPTTDVRYLLTVGGAPVFPQLSFFPRAATAAGDNYDAYVRVMQRGAQIGFQIQNVDGGSYTVGAIVTGWRFSAAAAERYLAGG